MESPTPSAMRSMERYATDLLQRFGMTMESFLDYLRSVSPTGTLSPILGAAGVVGLSGAIMYYMSSKNKLVIEPVCDLKNQTVELSPTDHSRVSKLLAPDFKFKEYLFEDALTLYQGFRRGAKASNNGQCLGYRAPVTTNGHKSAGPYQWLTYNEVLERSENLARGFVRKGLHIGQSTFIGIYSANRPEWIITEQACYCYSMVIVALYDTLGPEACSFVVNQAEIRLVVVEQSSKAEALLRNHEKCPMLRTIVLIEPAESGLLELAKQLKVEIVDFKALEKLGKESASSSPAFQPPAPNDLATISYTSGTTGNPKGVMLTHANVVADCSGMIILKYVAVQSSDVMISFLPLAHMFERVLEAVMYSVGGRVGFYSGDIKYLVEDIKELRPTMVPVVPRVLNRIYDKVMHEASSSRLKRFMINKAIEAKTATLRKSIIQNDSIWDKIVFKRVREGMGGRVRLMVTGSAPLAEEVLTFIRASMGCIVLEGYGQTECVAAATLTFEGDHIPGHVGVPLPCCQIKLIDVPEMNYLAREGKGEVCIKGNNVFRGYYKDPEKTAEALDADGWLLTGDIGTWTAAGTLKLIDRKKHIFKLSQGEYIAPEKIENVYIRSRFVGQIYVHGEGLKACLVAIVSPDPDVLQQYAKNEMKLTGNMIELCKNETVKKIVFDDMVAEGKQAGLQSFEQVKDIYLHPEPFTIESNMLTPTMKSKRAVIKDVFKKEIDQMYSHLY